MGASFSKQVKRVFGRYSLQSYVTHDKLILPGRPKAFPSSNSSSPTDIYILSNSKKDYFLKLYITPDEPHMGEKDHCYPKRWYRFSEGIEYERHVYERTRRMLDEGVMPNLVRFEMYKNNISFKEILEFVNTNEQIKVSREQLHRNVLWMFCNYSNRPSLSNTKQDSLTGEKCAGPEKKAENLLDYKFSMLITQSPRSSESMFSLYKKCIKGYTVTLEQANLLSQLIYATHSLHTWGIVHQDMHWGNVMTELLDEIKEYQYNSYGRKSILVKTNRLVLLYDFDKSVMCTIDKKGVVTRCKRNSSNAPCRHPNGKDLHFVPGQHAQIFEPATDWIKMMLMFFFCYYFGLQRDDRKFGNFLCEYLPLFVKKDKLGCITKLIMASFTAHKRPYNDMRFFTQPVYECTLDGKDILERWRIKFITLYKEMDINEIPPSTHNYQTRLNVSRERRMQIPNLNRDHRDTTSLYSPLPINVIHH